MKITIFAATGGVGRLILKQAIAEGHDVTVVVRKPENVHENVPKITADLLHADLDVLAKAVDGADAVLSGLGPSSPKEAGIAAAGTRAIIKAMREAGTRRIIVISAAPVSTVPTPSRPSPPKHDAGDGPLMRYLLMPMLRRALPTVYADLAQMEDALRTSGLDWTVVRPPRLNDKPRGRYKTAFDKNIKGSSSASRADVADLMLKLVNQPESIGHTVGVARS